MTIILGCVCALLVLALVVVVAFRPRPTPVDELLAERLLERFVVTMSDGQAFGGLLRSVDARTLVLREAELLSGSQAVNVPVDGELVLARDRVAYMQRT